MNALVLPALPFGPTPEHRGFGSGYVDLPAELHELVIGAVLRSLADQGFGRIVVWRGCGQHDLTGTVERFNEEYAGRCRACVPDFPHHDIWCRVADPSVAGGHADSYTTSILMHLRPDAVRADRIPPPDGVPDDWDDPALDFTAISSSGVVGDATHASAELGERLWAEVVNVVATVLREAAAE